MFTMKENERDGLGGGDYYDIGRAAASLACFV